MVKDAVWELAWMGWHAAPGSDAPTLPLQQLDFGFPQDAPRAGSQLLCIGCLEHRIGRTLTHLDFTDVLINDPSGHCSERLRDRLTSGIAA
jgi:hypothetical protein